MEVTLVRDIIHALYPNSQPNNLVRFYFHPLYALCVVRHICNWCRLQDTDPDDGPAYTQEYVIAYENTSRLVARYLSQFPRQDIETISEVAEQTEHGHIHPNAQVYQIMLDYCMNNPLEEVQI